jgi:hypothetical protein
MALRIGEKTSCPPPDSGLLIQRCVQAFFLTRGRSLNTSLENISSSFTPKILEATA